MNRKGAKDAKAGRGGEEKRTAESTEMEEVP